MNKTLVIGIGNNGRADDGLGWEFMDRISEDQQFEVIYRYQLQVEDADLISNYDKVWFVDATLELYEKGFTYIQVEPQAYYSFTSHELLPSTILSICHDLYGKLPETHLLAISGVDWELGNEMTVDAKKGLENALEFFRGKVESVHYDIHDH